MPKAITYSPSLESQFRGTIGLYVPVFICNLHFICSSKRGRRRPAPATCKTRKRGPNHGDGRRSFIAK